jgi:cellulose biosynthesis protein BcsQ
MTGQVATFYSYKGGVGRSFLVANTAAVLARWGYRVLCIDWDLEAPGLEEYFAPWLGPQRRPGLVELVTAFADDQSPAWRDHVTRLSLPSAAAPLDLITAGVPGPTRIAQLQAIDWRALYDGRGFGTFLEEMRDAWKESYDLVLVDSRTGVTDIGGICTVHLPDILVAVLTANQQSLAGVRDVLAMVTAQRNRLPLNRAGLLTLPVLSRFDARGQDDLAKEWLRRIGDELAGAYEGWLEDEVSPRQFLELARVPYFSVWTFGERLCALEERETDPESITYYVANLAALLAQNLDDAGMLARQRDSYVDRARQLGSTASRSSTETFAYDYFVSYSGDVREIAREVAQALRAAGSRVFLDLDTLAAGSDIGAALEEALQRSKNLVMLRGTQRSFVQLGVFETFYQRRGEDGRLAYDVRLASLDEERDWLPKFITLRVLDAAKLSPTAIAAELQGRPGDGDRPVDDELLAQADHYLHLRISDYGERVATKDRMAREMGEYVRAHGISHDALAAAAHVGLTVALAEAAAVAPQPRDLDRLLIAGPKVQRSHAAFRVLTVVGALLERTRLGDVQRALVEKLIVAYQELANTRDDDPLRALAVTTSRRLKNLA